jgi:pimeloyl-ACP methyl ester carboxylesterase
MPAAHNGDVELYYETFGSPSDPALVLVNGLGSQCINFDERWCEQYAARGFRVIRFDNRDTGLSTKFEHGTYALRDMVDDVLAVMDAAGVARAHVLGVSMGGMLVQRLAIEHGERLLSMTSVMSRTGEADYGQSSPEALAVLTGKPAGSRDEYIEHQVVARSIYGSKPEWIDESYVRERAANAYDRCFHPAGIAHQMRAIMRDGDRTDGLRALTVPTLVMHGDRDTLIDPSGGRRTAELIPGARYVEIEGMGHDYPPAVWDRWVDEWTDFALTVAPMTRPDASVDQRAGS